MTNTLFAIKNKQYLAFYLEIKNISSENEPLGLSFILSMLPLLWHVFFLLVLSC